MSDELQITVEVRENSGAWLAPWNVWLRAAVKVEGMGTRRESVLVSSAHSESAANAIADHCRAAMQDVNGPLTEVSVRYCVTHGETVEGEDYQECFEYLLAVDNQRTTAACVLLPLFYRSVPVEKENRVPFPNELAEQDELPINISAMLGLSPGEPQP